MMKSLLSLTFLLAVASLSAQVKIATVDMAKLFDGYNRAQSVEAGINADIQKAAAEAQRRQADGRALADQMTAVQQKIANEALTPAARDAAKKQARDIEDKLEAKRMDFEKFQMETRKALATKERTQREAIFNEIKNASTAVARKMGANIVLNTSEKTTGGGLPTVIFADKTWDITDAVIKTLNAGATTAAK